MGITKDALAQLDDEDLDELLGMVNEEIRRRTEVVSADQVRIFLTDGTNLDEEHARTAVAVAFHADRFDEGFRYTECDGLVLTFKGEAVSFQEGQDGDMAALLRQLTYNARALPVSLYQDSMVLIDLVTGEVAYTNTYAVYPGLRN